MVSTSRMLTWLNSNSSRVPAEMDGWPVPARLVNGLQRRKWQRRKTGRSEVLGYSGRMSRAGYNVAAPSQTPLKQHLWGGQGCCKNPGLSFQDTTSNL